MPNYDLAENRKDLPEGLRRRLETILEKDKVVTTAEAPREGEVEAGHRCAYCFNKCDENGFRLVTSKEERHVCSGCVIRIFDKVMEKTRVTKKTGKRGVGRPKKTKMKKAEVVEDGGQEK